jgi:signal transduction histidine kinase
MFAAVESRTGGISEQLDGIFNVIPDLASPLEVQTALRAILDDATLEMLWWDWEGERYVDVFGVPVALVERPGRAVTPVEYESRKIGLLTHDAKLLERPEFLTVFVPMMRIAMERDRLHRDLNAKLDQLRASRQRLVETSEAERRRLERNLHDGAQQRLVVAVLRLGVVEERLAGDPELAELTRGAREELEAAIDDLRELARGLHPPLLTSQGLAAAVRAGVERVDLPVELELQLEGKLPDAVESAAYYVSREAVTNAVKHAHATHLWLRFAHEGPTLTVEVRDDGVGGARVDGGEGTGLHGIRDRVEALEGTLALESPPGAGTRLVAVFPLGA